MLFFFVGFRFKVRSVGNNPLCNIQIVSFFCDYTRQPVPLCNELFFQFGVGTSADSVVDFAPFIFQFFKLRTGFYDEFFYIVKGISLLFEC